MVRQSMTTIDAASRQLRPLARRLWEGILRLSHRFGQRPLRRLRLCESLPLGERRFVAVVEFEAARFLVGGTSSSLVLLARLEAPISTSHRSSRNVLNVDASNVDAPKLDASTLNEPKLDEPHLDALNRNALNRNELSRNEQRRS